MEIYIDKVDPLEFGLELDGDLTGSVRVYLPKVMAIVAKDANDSKLVVGYYYHPLLTEFNLGDSVIPGNIFKSSLNSAAQFISKLYSFHAMAGLEVSNESMKVFDIGGLLNGKASSASTG